MLQQKHDSQDVIDRKWKVSAVVGLSIRAGQISSGQQHLTDIRASIYVNCFWFLMLIWQFLLNPLLSKHGFCQTKRNESCQCGVKILCLRSVIARFLDISRMWKLIHSLHLCIDSRRRSWNVKAEIRHPSPVSQQRDSQSKIFDLMRSEKRCPNPSFSSGLQLAAEQRREMAKRKETWMLDLR